MTPHGLMFHYFHDEKNHIPSQGSISAEEFQKLIFFYQESFEVLSANEWYEKAVNGTLGKKDVCITFDDGLKCQYDIALPVLKKLNLKAFWFIYTSPACDQQSMKIELYRYFRFKNFKNVDDFYSAFNERLFESPHKEQAREALSKFKPAEYLKEYPFYTDSDKKFRFFRDSVLGQKKYESIMDKMVENSLNIKEVSTKLWINKKEMTNLSRENHIIGLHSHSHPTNLHILKKKEQEHEYQKNCKHLEEIIGKCISSMSHPCGLYSSETLQILRRLGIKVGFRDNMAKKEHDMLEFPRLDHTYLIKQVR